MGKILTVCLNSGQGKVIDVEQMQEIERLLKTSFRCLEESEILKKRSGELGERALELILSNDLALDTILEKIKSELIKDG